MTLIIKGSGLTIEDVIRVARQGEKVQLDPQAIERINKCRAMLERKIEAHEIMYGVNTGIGEFSEMVLNDEQVKEFQKYLIYNHAAGIGDPMPIDWVRGAMLGRINVHAHGNSGSRIEITQTLVDMLNKGVTPYVCQKGSVGACGDLAPMSQIALLMMGEGQAYYEGKLYEGREALDLAGIPVPGLKARDGLATINGSNVLTAMSALFLYDANNWLKQAEIAASMSLEAMKANMRPYSPKLHEIRGFKGAIRSAAAILKCVTGGDLAELKVKCKVQDAYSMRSTPQVIGAALDEARQVLAHYDVDFVGPASRVRHVRHRSVALVDHAAPVVELSREQRTRRASPQAPVRCHLELRHRGQERVPVDLPVRMVKGDAHLDAAVLEDEHVVDVLSRAELGVAMAPHPHQGLGPLGRERPEGGSVIVGVHDDLRCSVGRLEGREAIVEDRYLVGGHRDLGLGTTRVGWAQRALRAGGQKRPLLPVDRVRDPLAAKLVEAQLAHGRPGPVW